MDSLFLHLSLAALSATALAVVSRRAGALTTRGAAAQAALGFLLLGFGGWAWTLPILTFFLLSSLLSRRDHGPRRARQVLANGAPAGAAVLFWAGTGDPAWFGAYVGSVAAATADTWGTEIGGRSVRPPRLITTWKTTEPGRSGAVTPLGLMAGLAGCLVIGVSAIPGPAGGGAGLLAAALVAGMSGAMADSLAGALLQARYECASCGRIVESPVHCGTPGRHHTGLRRLDNDGVNLLCTAVGAVIGYLLRT